MVIRMIWMSTWSDPGGRSATPKIATASAWPESCQPVVPGLASRPRVSVGRDRPNTRREGPAGLMSVQQILQSADTLSDGEVVLLVVTPADQPGAR